MWDGFNSAGNPGILSVGVEVVTSAVTLVNDVVAGIFWTIYYCSDSTSLWGTSCSRAA